MVVASAPLIDEHADHKSAVLVLGERDDQDAVVQEDLSHSTSEQRRGRPLLVVLALSGSMALLSAFLDNLTTLPLSSVSRAGT